MRFSSLSKFFPGLLVCIILLASCAAGAPADEVTNEAVTNAVPEETTSEETAPEETAPEETTTTYILPPPVTDGGMSVEYALENRRSQRSFQDKALSPEQISQILWAAYGITESGRGLRTAPSAGALYPLEIYAVIGNVDGVTPGVYKYIADGHKLALQREGDVRDELSGAAFNQSMVREAPASVFFSAVFSRTTERYGERGRHFIYIEVGHAAQNVYLQAEALGLGTCAIGTVTDDAKDIIGLPAEEDPLYLMPFGYFK